MALCFKCIYHLRLSPFTLHCINSQHDFKAWGENRRIMLHENLDFWHWHPVEKWFLRTWFKLTETGTTSRLVISYSPTKLPTCAHLVSTGNASSPTFTYAAAGLTLNEFGKVSVDDVTSSVRQLPDKLCRRPNTDLRSEADRRPTCSIRYRAV